MTKTTKSKRSKCWILRFKNGRFDDEFYETELEAEQRRRTLRWTKEFACEIFESVRRPPNNTEGRAK